MFIQRAHYGDNECIQGTHIQQIEKATELMEQANLWTRRTCR
jgi:hypothetical protein